MENEGNQQPEGQPEANEQREGVPNRPPFTIPINLNLADLLGGAKSVHEVGVNGSVIEQTAKFVERNLKHEVIAIEEPGTGIEAFAVVSQHGVQPLPASIFDDARVQPKYRAGTASMLSLESFIAHVNRFSDDDSVVFANNDRTRPSLTAVLDYNVAGATSAPRFGSHRTAFAFPLSDEWKAWAELNAKPMKMVQFARFLEDHIIDVMPPSLINLNDDAERFVETLGGRSRIADPAKLMELANGLQIFENAVVKNAHNLASGEAQIEIANEHLDAAGQKLNLPSLFVIGIPVFANGEPYQIIARFRYRKDGGNIVFWYELWRTDRVFDHAFNESVERVKDETGLPVLLGSDEAGALRRASNEGGPF